jgi:hypothetical protein
MHGCHKPPSQQTALIINVPQREELSADENHA